MHGWLWGEGDINAASDPTDATNLWLVLKVEKDLIVELTGKVKFPRCVVVFCGSREHAAKYIGDHGGEGRKIIYGTATAGNRGTATAGEKGIIAIRWWDGATNRYRLAIGYVGEDGILPGCRYRLADNGEFEALPEEGQK